jgi:hypothetical protein
MTTDRLYNLLPVVYRQRDLEQGGTLQMLLRVIEEQVNLIEGDIAQLYDNWFIETCQDWVVPYLADLIGYRPVHPLGDAATAESIALDMALVPRREVANTIGYRRRKGTLALLEDLAFAASGWPARVVEFDRFVSSSQGLDHTHLSHGRYADLHAVNALDLLGSAFDPLSHSVDIRGAASPYSQGRYGIANVTVFLWRLRPFSVTRSLAYCIEEIGDQCFTFSILGNDVPLFNSPARQAERRTVEEIEVPGPIRRHAFSEKVEKSGVVHIQASEKYYGEGKSVAIWAPGWADTDPNHPIPAERIIPANLAEWKYRPKQGRVAVDPELGRITFPQGQVPQNGVWVSFYYGFSAEMGGGEYERPTLPSAQTVKIYSVGADAEFRRIHDAYEHWHKEQPQNAIIEIADSGVYEEEIHISLGAHQSLELRAANGARPVIYLVDWHSSRPDALTVTGDHRSSFALDGILITGRGIEVRGDLQSLEIRHSTLVPGWGLHSDCAPRRRGEPSLMLMNTKPAIQIEHSILGAIQIVQEADDVDPVSLQISDTILDANGAEFPALSTPDEAVAPAVLTIQRSTVFGSIQAHSIALAENSIFTGALLVARRQQGCIRFCYVPPGSRTPKRYHCQPKLAEQAQQAQSKGLDAEDARASRAAERLRVAPEFRSTLYGRPDYGRLTDNCAVEIRTGSDDQSEMGVFHNLFEAPREDNLGVRLAEYTPAGIDAGIIFAT